MISVTNCFDSYVHNFHLSQAMYFIYIYIRSSHKFVPTFVYTFHVSIFKHTGNKGPMHLSLADREQARADFRGYKIVI